MDARDPTSRPPRADSAMVLQSPAAERNTNKELRRRRDFARRRWPFGQFHLARASGYLG